MDTSVEKNVLIDLRIRRTLKNIRNAFYELSQLKPVTSITVRELTERAEINKSTFYLHYENIPHLIETLMDEAVTETIGSDDQIRVLMHDPALYITESTKRIVNHPFSRILKNSPVEIMAHFLEKYRFVQEQKIFSLFPDLKKNNNFKIVCRLLSYGSVYCFLTTQDSQHPEEITAHVGHITELLWKDYHFLK